MTERKDIDFSTLNWVKQELDDTLKQSRQALEAYVEDPADKSQMRFCVNYLHQVQGTLRMVELYGAAMVAEEMERLAGSLLDGEIRQVDDAYSVLMRGMVQLPDYLERLQGGHRDIPVVLLPLLNDLRACRNEKLLTESALFSPDLTLPLPSRAQGPSLALPDDQARANAQKLRLAYQFSLLKWFRGEDVAGNLTRLQAVLDRLMQTTAQLDGRRLWFAGGAVLQGIAQEGIESGVSIKLLYGRVDREIKKLIDGGESIFAQLQPIDLTRSLLYYAAHSSVLTPRLKELQETFRLAKLLPTQDEIEHAKTAMSGHNRALLDTVGAQVKEDLLRVKDGLDMYLRSGSENVGELAPQGEALHRIGDTLGMLGLGVPRRIVLEQKDVIVGLATGKREIKEQTLLDVAGSLLYVESTLDDYIEGLGRGKESGAEMTVGALELPQSEVRRILEATMKEAQTNLVQAKQDVVAFIESPWDHSKIESIPRLFDEIAGALRMLNQPEPAGLMEGVIRFTEVELLEHRRVPSSEQLDLLADAIASIEYYLESVRDQRPNRERILDVTRRSLEALGYWPIPGAQSEADGVDRPDDAPNEMLNFRDDFVTAHFAQAEPEVTLSDAQMSDLPTLDLDDAPSLQLDFGKADESAELSFEVSDDFSEIPALSSNPSPDVGSVNASPELDFDFDLQSLDGSASDQTAVPADQEGLSFGLDLDASETDSPTNPTATDDDSGMDALAAELEALDAETETETEIETEAGDAAFIDVEFERVTSDDSPTPSAVESVEDQSAEVVHATPAQDLDMPSATEVDWITAEAAQAEMEGSALEAPAPPPPTAPIVTPSLVADIGFQVVPMDDIDEEIREVFVEEVQEEVSNLQSQYPLWKANTSDVELLKPIRRSFHTLKGSGRLVGAMAIGEYSWKIENMLNRLLDKSIQVSPAMFALLDEAIDVLPQLLEALRGGSNPTANIGAIMAVAERISNGEEAYLPKNEPVAAPVEVDSSVTTAGPIDGENAIDTNEDAIAVAEIYLESDDYVGNEGAQGEPPAVSSEPELDSVDLGSLWEDELPESEITPLLMQADEPSVEAQIESADSGTISTDFGTTEDEAVIDTVGDLEALFDTPEPAVDSNADVGAFEVVDDDTIPEVLRNDVGLRDILVSEIDTHLGTIQAYLDAVDQGGDHDVSHDLMRAVHTMNGAVSMVGMPLLTNVLSPLEGLLKRLRTVNRPLDAKGMTLLRDTVALSQLALQGLARGSLADLESKDIADMAISLRDHLPDSADAGAYSAFGIHMGEEEHSEEPEAISLLDQVLDESGEEEPALVAAGAEQNAERPWYESDLDELESAILLEDGESVEADADTEATALESLELVESLETVEIIDMAEFDVAEYGVDAVETETALDDQPTRGLADALDNSVDADDSAVTAPVEDVVAQDDDIDAFLASLGMPDDAMDGELVDIDEVDLTPKAFSDRSVEDTEIDELPAPLANVVEAQDEIAEELAGFMGMPFVADSSAPSVVGDTSVDPEPIEETDGLELASVLEAAPEPDVVNEQRAVVTEQSASSDDDSTGLDAAESADLEAAGRSAPQVDADPEGELDLPDLDRELLEIFVQEGIDILDAADPLLVKLREDPEDRDTIVALQRELHTLKGSARMAGLNPIGDLTHAMESLFEAVVDGRADSPRGSFDVLEQSFDRLNRMVQRVGKNQQIATPLHVIDLLDRLTEGQTITPENRYDETALPAPVAVKPQVAITRPSAPQGKRMVVEEEERPATQEMIRVRADLIDNLVNYAGEVSIYRSRLEAQIGGFRFNLQEFDTTTLRLREQLRKLEMETEAQILSRFQRETQDSRGEQFDPLELDRFSTLQQLSRALAESLSDLVSLQGLMDDIARQSETLLLQQSRVSSELQEGLMRTRMVPFESVVPRLRRILRQTSGELGKKAQLRVEGAHGEMDRTVLERMTAPLEHMLRNALAHGLETPENRLRAGKSDEGVIVVNVAREGTEVLITVSDDGRGMDRDAIRSRAIERGLLRPEVQLSDRDLFQFILETGFSTAESVSKVAGRGVGMDVVNNEVKMLGGSLQIDSVRGKGSVFTIRLPFTLAITQAVLIKLADHLYAVPMSAVTGVVRISRAEFDRRIAEKQLDVTYGGESFQIHDLGELIAAPIAHVAEETQVPLLMTKTGDQRAAIRVSHVIGGKEIVVKSVGAQLSSVPGFFGATIMGDGSVVVILDLAPLVRHGVAVRQAPELAAELDLLPRPVTPIEVRRNPMVMVVDDSITMRKVTTRVLERNQLDVITAKDGLDAVEQLQDKIPDLILLDIEMPRMDGYELATYIRNDARLRHLPLIMITSRTGEKHRQRAIEIGVDRYIGKPYQETDLMKNVQEALSDGRTTTRH